jgi:hypothetical protein
MIILFLNSKVSIKMDSISDNDLLSIFKKSPLSRRSIRIRLGQPPNKVVSTVIYSALSRGVIRKVHPIEVGYGGHNRPSYAAIR